MIAPPAAGGFCRSPHIWLLPAASPACLQRACCFPLQYDSASVTGKWSNGTASPPPPPPRQPSATAGSLRPALSLTLLCPVFSKTGSCAKGELCKMVSSSPVVWMRCMLSSSSWPGRPLGAPAVLVACCLPSNLPEAAPHRRMAWRRRRHCSDSEPQRLSRHSSRPQRPPA